MKFITFGLAVVVLATAVLGIPLSINEADAEIDYRLPTDILPWNYNIALRPYLLDTDGTKQFTFDGEVFITINTSISNLQTIVLHSKNLTYSLKELYQTADPTKTIVINSAVDDDTNDKLTLNLASALAVNVKYTLHFVYTGLMKDDMYGFYRSYYIDEKNQKKWLGSTQFQTNHARRAFPSFDEPLFKATFDVSITRHKSFNTVINTRLISSTTVETDYVKDVFATTPIMSTYLLAFLVSEFTERTDNQFSIIARPEFAEQTEYSFTVGKSLLAEFDKYTNLPYYGLGVDKMHMAAIPDFSAGAMENWGLLTYRERSLIYHKESTALSAKQAIAAIISHEQAHMWFGDLVTCKWWSYTWLNEGFARYFQYFMTAVVHPELELDKQFVVDQIQSVFVKDSTADTNSLSDETAASPADLSRMFNTISYNKGASVIRMVKHAIGEDNFKKSLQSYLKEFQYKNTVPTNLFDHWKANWPTAYVSYADGVLSSFTELNGYPVIYCDVASDSKSMTIQQKRFLLNYEDGSATDLLYTVPFTYTTSLEKDFKTTTPKLYLPSDTNKVTVTFAGEISWVIANIQETGYYRVNYSEMAWHKIHSALKSSEWSGIHELNRAQIVDDLLALSRSGDLSYDLSLNCLNYLETETNFLPWTAAFNGFDYLAIRLGVDTENFGNYITSLTTKVYKALGFDEKTTDTSLDIFTRSKVISWLCKYGHEECISKSLEIFRKLSTTPVPVNIRGAVYCTAMRDGTESDFETLYNKFQAERVPTEQTLIISNLGCIREQKLVERYFNIIVSDEIRRQDKSAALTSLYTNNAENVQPVFDLVTKNFEALSESLGSYSSVASVISGISSRFTSEAQQKQLETFINTNGAKFGTSVSTLKTALSTVKQNLAWADKKLGTIVTFLEGFKSGGAGSISISVFTITLAAVLSFVFH